MLYVCVLETSLSLSPLFPPAALRFCRRIVGLKDEFYNRYIVRNNLFKPIIKAFIANGRRYNLINSAIIELFEYIKLVSYPWLEVIVTVQHVLCITM